MCSYSLGHSHLPQIWVISGDGIFLVGHHMSLSCQLLELENFTVFLSFFEVDVLIIKSRSFQCLVDRSVKANLYFSWTIQGLIVCFSVLLLTRSLVNQHALPPQHISTTVGQSLSSSLPDFSHVLLVFFLIFIF